MVVSPAIHSRRASAPRSYRCAAVKKHLCARLLALGLSPHDGRHPSTVRALLRFTVLLHSFVMPSLAHPSERLCNLLNRACCRFRLACAALHESIDDGPTATDVRARASHRKLWDPHCLIAPHAPRGAALSLCTCGAEPCPICASHSSSPLRQGIGKVGDVLPTAAGLNGMFVTNDLDHAMLGLFATRIGTTTSSRLAAIVLAAIVLAVLIVLAARSSSPRDRLRRDRLRREHLRHDRPRRDRHRRDRLAAIVIAASSFCRMVLLRSPSPRSPSPRSPSSRSSSRLALSICVAVVVSRVEWRVDMRCALGPCEADL